MPPKNKPTPTEPAEPAVFDQAPDEQGRIVLDRPATTDEAVAQDEANRKRLAENRAKRFAGRPNRASTTFVNRESREEVRPPS